MTQQSANSKMTTTAALKTQTKCQEQKNDNEQQMTTTK
jgi:hypothetical protein